MKKAIISEYTNNMLQIIIWIGLLKLRLCLYVQNEQILTQPAVLTISILYRN